MTTATTKRDFPVLEFNFSEATIAGIFGLLTLLLGHLLAGRKYKRDIEESRQRVEKQDEEIKALHGEISFRAEILSFPLEPWQWSKLHAQIVQLIEETEIDRYFMLKAYNGKEDPAHATGIFMVVDNDYIQYEYDYYKLDHHYVSWLRKIRSGQPFTIEVAQMPADAKLRRDYEKEGVLSTHWGHYQDSVMSDLQTVAIAYCSYCSHTAKELSPETLARCDAITEMVQSWVNLPKAKEGLAFAKR